MSAGTMVAFPAYIGGMTGVAYVRIGARKVWVTLTDNQTLSIPRKEFPAVLPEGNTLAFAIAHLVSGGPSVQSNDSERSSERRETLS